MKLLEDELLRLREEALYNDKRSGTPGGNHILQVESLKSQEKLLKAKVCAYLWLCGYLHFFVWLYGYELM